MVTSKMISKSLLFMFLLMVATCVFFLAFADNYSQYNGKINNDMIKLLDECVNNELDDYCQSLYNILDRLCQWEYFPVCFTDKYSLVTK